MKDIVGTMTSSPEDTPDKIKEICKAEVPLIQAIAYFEFVNFLTSSSNNSTYLPAVDTKVLNNPLHKYFLD